jgi:hypothetical protein
MKAHRITPTGLVATYAEGEVSRGAGVRLWALSARDAMPRSGIRIVVLSPDPRPAGIPETVEWQSCNPIGRTVWSRRWAAYSALLAECRDNAVALTDCRDLVFQGNPFIWAKNCGPDDIWWASEYQATTEHVWCMDQAKGWAKLVGGYETADEVNGGCIIGGVQALRVFAAAIGTACDCLPDPALTDQPVLNWWRCHRAAGINQHILPEQAYLHGDTVRRKGIRLAMPKPGLFASGAGLPAAAIFHQYDRTGHQSHIRSRFSPGLSNAGIVLVVARFNEDVSWLGRLFPDLDRWVVEKGTSSEWGTEQRPNVGREAETWAAFFADHYDELPEWSVCLQGKPWDHVTEDEVAMTVKRLNGQTGFSPLGMYSAWCDIEQPDHARLPLLEWWNRLFPVAPPLRFCVTYGGQFAVHRDVVRRRTRQWWARTAGLIQTYEDACCLERLWPQIFMGA